jgi:hypothetical protein
MVDRPCSSSCSCRKGIGQNVVGGAENNNDSLIEHKGDGCKEFAFLAKFKNGSEVEVSGLYTST